VVTSFSLLRRADLVERLDQHREADRGVEIALGDVEAEPSTISEKPIIIRKPRHRITTVGCLETKAISGFDETIMTPHRDDHRDHHDGQMLDHADRGDDAVEREHRVEHDDLHDDLPEHRVRELALLGLAIAPSSRSCSSIVPLNSRNTPPNIRIRSRPEKLEANNA
jgi:hypothetical protein